MTNEQLRSDVATVAEAARAYADDLVGRSHSDHNIKIADRILAATSRLETYSVSLTHRVEYDS